jgi:hypothetical protein
LRDYVSEMDALFKQACAGSGWAVPVVAQRIYEHLLHDDNDLLQGWLDEMALPLLTKAIGDRVRQERLAARAAATTVRFRQAMQQAADGDTEALSLYLVTHVVGPGHTRKRAKDMTGREHLHVATRYEKAGVEALTLGAFHAAVAERIGEHRTEEVLNREEYEQLYRNITGAAE